MRRRGRKNILGQYKYQIYGMLTLGVLGMLSKSSLPTATSKDESATLNKWFFHFFGIQVDKLPEDQGE